MIPDAIIASALGVVSSIAVGTVLLGLRRAANHRDETAQHKAAIAVIDTRLRHIDCTMSHVADALDRLEDKFSMLPCTECAPMKQLEKRA